MLDNRVNDGSNGLRKDSCIVNLWVDFLSIVITDYSEGSPYVGRMCWAKSQDLS